MPVNFPTPYPDELFYSLCARYGERTSYSNHKMLLEELFGRSTAIAVFDLPNSLEVLARNLPSDHPLSGRHFINDHSLYPFFRPFLPLDRIKLLEERMRHQGAVHTTIGVMASSIRSPTHLKYCPTCVKQDRERYGETYWHRLPQLPGIEVCPAHLTQYELSSIKRINRQTRHSFVSAESVIEVHESKTIGGNSKDLFLWLAEQAKVLLSDALPILGIVELQRRYRWQLAEHGLATYSGRVKAKNLVEAFLNTHDQSTLERIQCPVSASSEHNWLLRLVRSPKGTQHPLRHLLFLKHLGLTVRTFFKADTPLPFGRGPWPCLNRASSHYHKPVVPYCEVSYTKDYGKPVGTFACECGFTYARTGPDRERGDQFYIDRMIAFGDVWLERLEELWFDPGVSLRELSRRLGVDPRTAQRQARNLALSSRAVVIKEPPAPLPKTEWSNRSEEMNDREQWVHLAEMYPQASRAELRNLRPDIYAKLYRKDKDWLKSHPLRPRSPIVRQTKIDWCNVDEQLAGEVEIVARNLRSAEGRPVKVTITSIGRELGRLALLQKHISKLPKTSASLKEYVDTREAFAVRRIEWVATEFNIAGEVPKLWQLVREAGIRPDLLHCEEVKFALEKALESASLS